MVHLEKVNGENIWDILKLSVSESQKNFVASNEVSILEAYAADRFQRICFSVRGL